MRYEQKATKLWERNWEFMATEFEDVSIFLFNKYHEICLYAG